MPLDLAHLENRETLDAGHGKPARLAVIGHPVSHSASPRMQQAALDAAGIDARYIALDIRPGHVAAAFARMRALGFLGCNVTVPHKFEALAACNETDDAAKDLGAVNTVRFDPDAIRGTNTDGYGFEQAVREAFGFDLAGKSVLVVGAGGGAGGAIAAHCAGAAVSRLVLANRTISKLAPLAASLRHRHPGLEIATVSADNIAQTKPTDLVVNTTSLGLAPHDPSPIPPGFLRPDQAVFDTIYEPSRTKFLQIAASEGARTANGAAMLLHQGVAAFRFWFPGSEPTAAMRNSLKL